MSPYLDRPIRSLAEAERAIALAQAMRLAAAARQVPAP
jgi:hypothetical protein